MCVVLGSAVIRDEASEECIRVSVPQDQLVWVRHVPVKCEISEGATSIRFVRLGHRTDGEECERNCVVRVRNDRE